MSRMRQAIARRMAKSKREAPHYYVTVAVEMTEAQRFRSQLNAALGDEAHVSVNDLLVKASAKALQRYPAFNTWFVDEQVQQQEAQNVCIGIALEEGLIAPAILDCGQKSLAEIARASRSLAERAKSGALKPDEYANGTFTISNLGMYGIEELIAIIQPPQTAILGVGQVKPTAGRARRRRRDRGGDAPGALRRPPRHRRRDGRAVPRRDQATCWNRP